AGGRAACGRRESIRPTGRRPRAAGLKISQGQIDQLLLELRVRRIHQLNSAEPRRLFEHAARVGEGFEAEPAVRFTDAALADAAERQIDLVEVDERVVDHSPAGPRTL